MIKKKTQSKSHESPFKANLNIIEFQQNRKNEIPIETSSKMQKYRETINNYSKKLSLIIKVFLGRTKEKRI